MNTSVLSKFDLFTAKVVERDSRVTVLASSNRKGEFRAHLRNTGRLEDLIFPGATVVCEWKEDGKTDARVIGAVDNGSYVLLDTYVQEEAFGKLLDRTGLESLPRIIEVKSQVSVETSRFDFGIKTESGMGYLELKSAVSCDKGWASYPDAPSGRGLEHIRLLGRLAREGVPVYVIFIVTHPNCEGFRPNGKIQPEMVSELNSAKKAGVKIFAVKMVLTEKGEVFLTDRNLPVSLVP